MRRLPFKRNAGVAGAAFGFIQMLISFVFAFSISQLPTTSPLPLSILLMVIVIVLFGLFWVVVHPNFVEEE